MGTSAISSSKGKSIVRSFWKVRRRQEHEPKLLPGGALVEQVESFFVAHAGAKALQAAFFFKADTNGFDGLPGLRRDGFEFVVDFIVGDGDIFALGNSIEQQR